MVDVLKKAMFALLPGLLITIFLESALPAAPYTLEKLIPHLIDRVTKWTIWPHNSGLDSPGGAAYFRIVIYGKHYFGNSLDVYYGHSNRKVKGRQVKLIYARNIKDIPIGDCHLIYIAEDLNHRKLTEILEYLGDRPILTMASSENFDKWGVHINVAIERKLTVDPITKIREVRPSARLVVNETAARKAGFLFGEKLKETIAEGSIHGKNVNPYFEYQDKAERLESIAEYVQWPDEARIIDKSVPFNIQVLGKHSFDSFLDNIYKDTRILEKKVSIRYITRVNDIRDDTNLLFICGSEADKLMEILKAIAGKPILTVGDTPDFCKIGIHINYFYDGAWLKFEVNRGALKQSNLDISYQVTTISRIRFCDSARR